MNRAATLGAFAMVLSGCAVPPARQASVPLPVECRVQTPARPAMPTEALRKGVDVDRWIQAAQAELLLREGYEGELQAALGECTAPLTR